MSALLNREPALMKPHNVLGQCFLNILVLSCDLEPIGFEECFKNASGQRERERPGEWCSLGLLPTQATHQEMQQDILIFAWILVQ